MAETHFGKDGSRRKLLSVEGDIVRFRHAMSGFDGTCTLAEWEAWLAEPHEPVEE